MWPRRRSGWPEGAIAGTAGKMVGSALGVLAGGGEEVGGSGGGGGGATVVGGGGIEGESGEMIRLLREISLNIRTLVNDGLFIKGDHRRTVGSVI